MVTGKHTCIPHASIHLMYYMQGQEGYESLYAAAMDGCKFIHESGAAISTSIPHLYLSALPFSPARSLI